MEATARRRLVSAPGTAMLGDLRRFGSRRLCSDVDATRKTRDASDPQRPCEQATGEVLADSAHRVRPRLPEVVTQLQSSGI
jgi:hypothetical protein